MKDLIKEFTEQEVHLALRNAGYKIQDVNYEDSSADSDGDLGIGEIAIISDLEYKVVSYDFFQNNKTEAVFYREFKRRLLCSLFSSELKISGIDITNALFNISNSNKGR